MFQRTRPLLPFRNDTRSRSQCRRRRRSCRDAAVPSVAPRERNPAPAPFFPGSAFGPSSPAQMIACSIFKQAAKAHHPARQYAATPRPADGVPDREHECRGGASPRVSPTITSITNCPSLGREFAGQLHPGSIRAPRRSAFRFTSTSRHTSSAPRPRRNSRKHMEMPPSPETARDFCREPGGGIEHPERDA